LNARADTTIKPAVPWLRQLNMPASTYAWAGVVAVKARPNSVAANAERAASLVDMGFPSITNNMETIM
jgi:hypothetical protein